MNEESDSLFPNLQLDLESRVDDIRWQDEKIFKNINAHLSFVVQKALSKVFTELTDQFSINVSLLLTHNKVLQNLNYMFRQNNAPTNVLSFPTANLKREELSDMLKDNKKIFLGDIAISYDKIADEWLKYTNSFQSHFNHMLVHGILHLCGYDHQNDKEAEMMEKLEQDILLQLRV